MKKILLSCFIFVNFVAVSQEISADSLLNDLVGEEEKVSLLPEKMLLTQRLFWGENGIYRKVGLAPKMLTAESREKELKIRRTMFRVHQAVGIATALGMAAQGYVGSRIYNPNTYTTQMKNIHEGLATGVNIGYATTAVMAFASPPPMISRKKFDSIKLHRYLSYIHLSGMIATNLLAENSNSKLHRAVAFTTFGAYAAAIASIKIEI